MSPWETVWPRATVPSWQLKHSLETPAEGVAAPASYVELV